MKSSHIFRIRLFSGLMFLVGLVLIGKLYAIQIVYGDIFRERGEAQYTGTSGATFNRGSIYFSDKGGNLVGAATLKSGYIISINPKLITEEEEVYEALSAITPIDRQNFFLRASQKSGSYREIAKHVPLEKGEDLSKLDIPGVGLRKERWRFYPGNTLASQVLGFVGYKGDVLAGRYGLERYYGEVLSRDERGAYANFFVQIFSNIKDSLVAQKLEAEGDIVLTIEPSVQSFLEERLKEVAAARATDLVGGIIIDPETGQIFAMAGYPDFDPNSYQEVKNPQVFVNPMVEGVYEMGSIIKPLTVAAGLDAGVITRNTTYNDVGTITLNGSKISNYDGKARGVVPVQEILNQSLNIGVAHIVSRLGNKRFADYMRNFGLGEKTGIDLPNEVAGIITNLNSPRDLEYANASFGQGIAMTPIETVRALSALGNGGHLITPHVVKRIDYRLGVSKDMTYPPGRQVIKEETSTEISRMLVEVVDEALLNGKAKLPHYSVGAKTGTAQIARENGRGYYEDRYLHSFFAYFPAYQPRFLIFFYAVNPHGVRYASETWTDSFSKTVKFLINYYEVPPDR
ncbi:MAG TPA: penicillin-binding protein 2 [Candidatus Paceibacterota bacterium]|nr:penicillin-binding protein 2 [Candidatus Paceibacterota bacterium]